MASHVRFIKENLYICSWMYASGNIFCRQTRQDIMFERKQMPCRNIYSWNMMQGASGPSLLPQGPDSSQPLRISSVLQPCITLLANVISVDYVHRHNFFTWMKHYIYEVKERRSGWMAGIQKAGHWRPGFPSWILCMVRFRQQKHFS